MNNQHQNTHGQIERSEIQSGLNTLRVETQDPQERAMRVWRGSPSPLGATWDGEGVNLPSILSTLLRSNSAFLTGQNQPRNSSVWICGARDLSGTLTCPMCAPTNSTGFGCMANTAPPKDFVLITTRCCSTRMPRPSDETSSGTRVCSVSKAKNRMTS